MAPRIPIRMVVLVIVGLALLLLAAGTTPGILAKAAFADAGPTHSGFVTVPDRSSGPLSFIGPDKLNLVVGPNVNVTHKPGAQSETAIAVDPTDPRHVLTASNDLADTTIIYESFDRGRTWVNSGLNLPLFCYDPWLTFNANGDAFFAYECYDQRVAYKLAGTTNWVKTTLNAGSFPDRDMIAADTNAGSQFLGSVYIGYDDASFNNRAHVMFSRTGTSGWLKSPKINDSGQTIGVNAAVLADGTITAVWEDWSNRQIRVDRSFDGGETWNTDAIVHNYRIDTSPFFLYIPPQPDRGVLPLPFSDAAPVGTTFAGRVYVVYFDAAVDFSGGSDIFVRYSDDAGVTWSGESQVNDDGGTAWHFHPSITVGPDGTVAVSFYSTRDDPSGEQTHHYVAYSTDGGVTWSANERITTAPSDESGFGDPNDYGDYQGIDAGPTGFYHITWTDSRIGSNAEDMAAAPARP